MPQTVRVLASLVRLMLCLVGILGLASPANAQAPFELRDGDRVVFLGDTLIEREQYHGWIELAMTVRFPDRHVTFRNLGWSADLPNGESRCGLSLLQAGHEPPDEGWRMLQEQIKQTKPTVVVLGYGMAASFAGETGLAKFKTDMERLMDTIQQLAGETNVRFIIMSPIPHDSRTGLPDPGVHNTQLAKYASALREIAKKREAVYVPLFDLLSMICLSRPITDNGIHLNAEGYRLLPMFVEFIFSGATSQFSPDRKRTAAKTDWSENPQAEKLRQVILKKNEWFFHRSRPANMAYIFGFRKREQGQNAVEIPQFDALIEAEEKKIALLRGLKPVELPAEPAPRTKPASAKFTPQPRPPFEVAPGFEVTLWAENPSLHKPIQMNFDPQGRLWVASSEVYPQVEPGQTPNDKIIILEDADGDGKAEKSSVFADGLLIPTGVEPGDGGCYVAQSTELLHFKDTNGDGKADVRRVVLSGFGTEDTHHNLHTLRWGHDGRLYMNQSIYTRTDTETPHGVVRLKSGGVMRLHPGTLKLDIMYRGFWNSWGHQFDQFGQSFLTDGAGGTGINWAFPGATFEAYAGARRVLKGISPGSYPKFCSLEIIYSDHFPPDWQGDMITCDFRANRVVRFKVMEEGAGYVAVEAGDLLRSKEVTFRPIDVKLGPDGALYIADWSNPIIQHGEVDFRDPRRDHEHGRIWRVTRKDRPLNPRPQLVKATNAELLDRLRSANGYERAQARRLLIERGKAVGEDLEAWQKRQTDQRAFLESLWLREAIAQPDFDLSHRLLRATDPRVRAAVVRVLGENLRPPFSGHGVHVGLALLVLRALDPAPRVRLEAVRGLARVQHWQAADGALRLLDAPMDRFLDYALWLTMNELADSWLPGIETETHEKRLNFGLSAVPPEKASRALAKLLEKHSLTTGPWIDLIAQAGAPAEIRRLFDQITNGSFDDPAMLRALGALEQATRVRRVRPDGDLQPLRKLLDDKRAPIRSAAVRLAGRWQQQALTPLLVTFATDPATPLEVRTAACEALRELRGPAGLTALETVAKNDMDPTALRRQALLALVAIDPEKSLPLVVETLKTAEDAAIEEFWRSLLGLAGMGRRLTELLQKEPLPKGAAVVGLRVARENDESQRDLVALLAKQAGVPPPRVYSTGELQRLVAQTHLRGDAARGELVYRRADLRCIVCHAIGGAGGKVGPDLTSIGASAPLDYLVESILLPNRKIKEGFHSQLITTQDGRVFTGILARETAQEVILRDANDKEIAVPRNAIDERGNAGSLMPSALVDNLTDPERLDLFRFLGELGRPGAFDATKSKSPRVWRLGADLPNSTAITTTVSGALLKAEVEAALPKDTKSLLAATRFEMPKAGKAKFELNATGKMAVRIDGKPVTLGKDTQIELAAGPHTLVIELELAGLPERFVLSSADVVFLAGP